MKTNENRDNKKLEKTSRGSENNKNFYMFLTGGNEKETSSSEDKGEGHKAISILRAYGNLGLHALSIEYNLLHCGHLVAQSKRDSFHISEDLYGINNGNNIGLETASENSYRGTERKMNERFDENHVGREIKDFVKLHHLSNKTDFNKWLKHFKMAYKTYLSIDWEAALMPQKNKLIKMGEAINLSREVVGLGHTNWGI